MLYIYPEAVIKDIDLTLIRIKDGIVIYQKKQLGDQLLKKVGKIFKKGPPKIARTEKKIIIPWAHKMLNRAKEKDMEGDFRRHWLLYDLLIAYFQLRDLWYLGPKESFQWLKENDLAAYKAFQRALKPQANFSDIKKLINKIQVIS